MRLALLLGELEHVEGALDVDVMGRDRCELGARGQERGQVEHAIDLELGQHAIDQVHVGDRPPELPRDQRRERRVQGVHVERDDLRVRGGKP